MERALVKYLLANGFVTGTWRGGDTLPVNQDPAAAFLEITLAQFEELAVKGLTYGNQYRWEVQGGTTLVERTDNRARVRFSPLLVEVDVGDPAPVVTVTRIDNNGNVVPTTGTVKSTILGHPIKIALVNGIGALTIPTTKPRDVTVGDGPNYRVEAPLVILIHRPNTLEL